MAGPETPAPPEPIQGLQWISLLGRGPQGQVWRALRLASRQNVAVKLFRDDPRFRWEFDRVHPTGHPHLATILDANLTHRPAYVILPVYTGSLGALAAQQNFRGLEKLAFDWVTSLASALAALHDARIFHCNIHPENILLDQEGSLRLADFEQTLWFGEKKRLLGSPLFMPPEQMHFDGQGRLMEQPSAAWDIYSLAASFYYVFSGQLARRQQEALASFAKDKNFSDLRCSLLATPFRSLHSLNANVPVGLARCLDRCLSLNPAERYRSAEELLESLSRARGKSTSQSLVLRWAEERRATVGDVPVNPKVERAVRVTFALLGLVFVLLLGLRLMAVLYLLIVVAQFYAKPSAE